MLCKAQSLSFQINSITSIPNMTISSLSFQLENSANCLTVSNGLSIYKPQKSTSVFKLGCIVPIEYDRYGLKVFPQPIGNYPRIQFVNPSAPNITFSIRCYNVLGRLVLEDSQTGIALSTGVTINTSLLPQGNYIIQVVSANSVDLIQVIK